MTELHVTLEAGCLRFRASADLPVAFSKQVAEENTIENDPRLVRKGAPERIQRYVHNPFTSEVRLPLSYYNRFLALAREHGIEVHTTDLRPWAGREEPIEIALAVPREELDQGLEHMARRLSVALPAAWDTVQLHVYASRYSPLPPDIRPLGPATQEEHLEAELPTRRPAGSGGDGGPQAPGSDPAKARPHHPRRRKVPPVPEPGGADGAS